jgi:hypothetical protein
MSEHEGGDSGKMGAFLLGFLVGVLVCLGAGGAFVMVVMRQQTMAEMRARDAEQMARMEAERLRDETQAARERAEKALRAAKEAVEKIKKE